VIDGDSVKLRIKLSTGTFDDECRMLRYNAPEMTGTERPMGRKAKRKLAGIVKGKKVRVRTDSRDRHGRMLCDMWLTDGTYVNAAMREFLSDYPRRDIYLWKEKSPMPGNR
jgi:endonuclease YncB( thermonuclease family)